MIREAIPLRIGLRRRLVDLVRRLLELDHARLNLVMAYIGCVWFGADAVQMAVSHCLDQPCDETPCCGDVENCEDGRAAIATASNRGL